MSTTIPEIIRFIKIYLKMPNTTITKNIIVPENWTVVYFIAYIKTNIEIKRDLGCEFNTIRNLVEAGQPNDERGPIMIPLDNYQTLAQRYENINQPIAIYVNVIPTIWRRI